MSFTKMVASGNDFLIIDQRPKAKDQRLFILAKKMCDRKYGAGADGLLILEKSKKADVKMRIFNADGSEAEMCGNGARCAALYRVIEPKSQRVKAKIKIETKAGIIEAEIGGDRVRIKLTDPKNIKLGIPLKVKNRQVKVNFINTGVPHAVIFVEGVDKIAVEDIGREIRHHKKFMPAGTNVNFVEILNDDSIKVRTYERGVEDETLACGTGSVASALLYALRYTPKAGRINVFTRSGEKLKVYFDFSGGAATNVWLEGSAKKVYGGIYYA